MISLIKSDPHARDYDDRTPLYEAAEDGNVDLIKAHAILGADLNAEDRFGSTPLKLAVENGHVEATITLITLGADWKRCNIHDLLQPGKYTEDDLKN